MSVSPNVDREGLVGNPLAPLLSAETETVSVQIDGREATNDGRDALSARWGTGSLAVGMLLLTSKRDTGEAVAGASGVLRLLRSASNAIRPVAPATLLGDDTPVRASQRPASGSGIEQMLSGGDPRSLCGVEQVIAAALVDASALEALFECLFCDDAVVRMRAGDAFEKIARIRPELLAPFTCRLLGDVADVDQPSIQWHLAQILAEIELTPEQRPAAIAILKRNLERYEDWIVLNLTLQALAHFARDDPELYRELVPILRSHQADPRKSVAKRASKLLAQLQQAP